MRFLFIFFIIIPLTEMMLLFEVSDRIGGLLTLSLVVATAVVGVQILKQQGLATLTRAGQRLQLGELPAQEIVEGILLAAAGALLLTPGFITDTIGFIFLTGPLRKPIARKIVQSGMVKTMGGSVAGGDFSFRAGASNSAYRPGETNIYEGDFSEESEALPKGREITPDNSKGSKKD